MKVPPKPPVSLIKSEIIRDDFFGIDLINVLRKLFKTKSYKDEYFEKNYKKRNFRTLG